MKKYLFSILALLLIVGVSHAQAIVDPTAGMDIEYTQVYNNSGGALDAGDVVVWDIGSSTGDDDAYVTTTTTADTFLVAGIVYPAGIAASSSGIIVTKGYAVADVSGTANTGTLLCTTTSAGNSDACSDPASDPNAWGYAVAAPSGGTAAVYVFD